MINIFLVLFFLNAFQTYIYICVCVWVIQYTYIIIFKTKVLKKFFDDIPGIHPTEILMFQWISPPPPKKKVFLIKLLKISGNLVRCSPFYKYQTPLHRTTGINIYMYYWISRNLFFKQIFENFRFINFTSKMFWEAMFHLSSIKIYGAYSHWICLL